MDENELVRRAVAAYGPMRAALRLVEEEMTDPCRRSGRAVLVSDPCKRAVVEALRVADGEAQR